MRIYPGGVASGDHRHAGRQVICLSGGMAVGTQLYASAGSDEVVLSGGQTLDETIYAGGFEDVHSGATTYNLTVLSGGTQELGNGTPPPGVPPTPRRYRWAEPC